MLNKKKIGESIEIFDLSFFSNDMSRLLAFLWSETEHKNGKKTQLISIFTPNPEQIVLASENPDFKEDLQQADIRIPDGIGLIIAQKVLNRFGRSQGEFAERITGVELSLELLQKAEREDWKCLVLGGRGYQNISTKQYRVQKVDKAFLEKKGEKKAIVKQLDNLTTRPLENSMTRQLDSTSSSPVAKSPSSQVIYWLDGYDRVSAPTREEEALIETALKKLQPDIVFVAFGAPHQEAWVLRHKDLLEKNKVRITLVVGGAFDVILGKLQRAPALVRTLGFEWLFRLLQEPHRWRRQLKLITFVKLVFQKLISKS